MICGVTGLSLVYLLLRYIEKNILKIVEHSIKNSITKLVNLCTKYMYPRRHLTKDNYFDPTSDNKEAAAK